ncbi:MAG: radical SAM protein [Cetobacterium sp.]|uniref:radical SAM protein n=1 Tax=Cetobacterium sp. TaxID=2071632 RepID=UPI003F2F5E12
MTTYEVVTNKNCNLECYFCFANANLEQKKDVLSLDDFIKGFELILKKVPSYEKEIFVKIYGGESMLHYDKVMEYLRYLKKRSEEISINIATTIITNGTVIPDDFVKEMDAMTSKKIRITFTFSMEAGRIAHDKIRTFKGGASSFDVVLNNITKYNTLRPGRVSGIQSVLSPELLNNVENYIEFMEENKDKGSFNLVPMFDETFENIDLKILDNMDNLFDYYKDCFIKNNSWHIGLFQPFRVIAAYVMLMKGFKTSHCDAGTTKLAINPQGDTFSCCRFDYIDADGSSYGNIKEVEKVNENFEKNKQFYADCTAFEYECKECQLNNKFGCLGKCLANSIAKDSTYNSKYNSICEYNKKFGLLSMKLWEDLKGNENFLKKMDMYCDSAFDENMSKIVKEIIRKGEVK